MSSRQSRVNADLYNGDCFFCDVRNIGGTQTEAEAICNKNDRGVMFLHVYRERKEEMCKSNMVF
jgi:hypothetical protein